MKILFITCKYDYGKPELGLSFEYYNFYNTLINTGNDVIYFPFDEIVEKFGKEKMNKQLLKVVEFEKPDLCFFFLFENQLDKKIIKKITESGKTITLNWFADDHWRFDNFSRYWAPCFNWIVTTDSEATEKYHKIGYKNVIKSQWACNHFLYKPLKEPKIYNVSFVGQPHGNRKKIIENAKNTDIDIECFGRGWANGKISQEKMVKIFSQSKINLNFAKCSGEINLKSIAGIFIKRNRHNKFIKIKLRKSTDWIGNFKSVLAKQRNMIKARNFEIPGCGSFLLTGYADNLKDYYEINKEIVCYENDEDLVEKIKYYLQHDKERESIAEAGYQRTLKEHTYEKRFNEIFRKIGLKNY